jgi:hypothetical protein
MPYKKQSIDLSGLTTYESRRALAVCLTVLLFLAVIAFFIFGGIFYKIDHRAEIIYTPSSCQVDTSRYYQSKCRSGRSDPYICYIPVWRVTYSLNENAVENRTNATIEHKDGYRTTAAAENKLNEYKVRKVEYMEFSKAVLIDHLI